MTTTTTSQLSMDLAAQASSAVAGSPPDLAPLASDEWLLHLNPNQRMAVCAPVTDPVQIMAGAGTGKTTVMAHRLVAYWLAAIRQQRQLTPQLSDEWLMALAQKALAVTFTVKAAEEMRHRVSQLVAKQAKAYPNDLAWQTLYRMSMDAADRVWIHHFHGVGRRLLLNHGAQIGWGPGFRVLDSQQSQQELAQLLEDVQHGRVSDCTEALTHCGFNAPNGADISPRQLSPDVLAQTLPRQLNAVLADAIGLIARAKSAGLTPLAFYHTMLNQTTAWHAKIMAIPQTDGMCVEDGFTSAQSMAEAFQQHFSSHTHARWSFLGMPYQRQGFMEERLASSAKADPNDWEPFFKEQAKVITHAVGLMKDGTDESPFGRFNRAKWVPGLSQSDRGALLGNIHSEEMHLLPVVTALYAVLQYRRYGAQTCDFDDLILHPVQLLQQSPQLQAQYQQQFSVRVVDEFQDTNGSQLALVRLLTPAMNPGLMVVGDTKQAIYGFRYAQPENMEQVFQGIHPAPTVLPLSTNYRSSKTIVALANGMARELHLPHTEDLTVPEGGLEVPCPPVRHVAFGPNPERETKPAMADYHQAEAQWLADDVARKIKTDGVDPATIAILVKDHARAQRFAQALQRVGIATVRDKIDGAVWHSPALRQWVALLAVLANPNDDVAWVTLLQEKLSQSQLLRLAKLSGALAAEHRKRHTDPNRPAAKTWPWWQTLQALSDPQRTPELLLPVRTALLALVERVLSARKDLARQQWQQQAMALANELGLWASATDSGRACPVEIEGWRQWQEGLATQPEYRRYTLRQWVQLCRQYRDKGEGFTVPSSENSGEENVASVPVTILTMHAAKGLEYDMVYVSAVDAFGWRGSEGWLDMEPRFATGTSTTLGSKESATEAGFGLYWAKHHRCWSNGRMATLTKRVVDEIWRKPRQQEETRRLVYVALTRARQQLTIMRCPVSPDWSDPAMLLSLGTDTDERLETVEIPV